MAKPTKKPQKIDPTKNVLQLVKAAVKRLNDLRYVDGKANKAARKCIIDVTQLNAKHNKSLIKREAKYVAAVRLIDTQAAKSESERAQRAIDALATITASNATAVQKALTDTAITISKQTADTFLQVTDRLAALEKTSNLAAGQSAVSDPALITLATDVRALIAGGNVGVGRTEGVKLSTTMIIAIASAAGVFSGFVLPKLTAPAVPVAASAPQIIYVPAQPGTLLPSAPAQTPPR